MLYIYVLYYLSVHYILYVKYTKWVVPTWTCFAEWLYYYLKKTSRNSTFRAKALRQELVVLTLDEGPSLEMSSFCLSVFSGSNITTQHSNYIGHEFCTVANEWPRQFLSCRQFLYNLVPRIFLLYCVVNLPVLIHLHIDILFVDVSLFWWAIIQGV
jgi:hypothetical protein